MVAEFIGCHVLGRVCLMVTQRVAHSHYSFSSGQGCISPIFERLPKQFCHPARVESHLVKTCWLEIKPSQLSHWVVVGCRSKNERTSDGHTSGSWWPWLWLEWLLLEWLLPKWPLLRVTVAWVTVTSVTVAWVTVARVAVAGVAVSRMTVARVAALGKTAVIRTLETKTKVWLVGTNLTKSVLKDRPQKSVM